MNSPLKGRDFDDRDVTTPERSAAPVTIINEAMARRYWPGEDPIGRQVNIHSFGSQPFTIIGVAGDVRSFGLDTDVGPMVYGSATANPGWNPMSLVIRSSDDPLTHIDGIREAIRSIDPTIPLYDVRTLNDLLADSFGSRRFNLYLLGYFAVAAAALSCIGLFGVLAYLVSQRTRDIGIRLALGAVRRDVLTLIVGRGMALALSGAAIGLVSALAAARVMKSLLFSISPWDLCDRPVTARGGRAVRVLRASPPGDTRGSVDCTAVRLGLTPSCSSRAVPEHSTGTRAESTRVR
jgi:putative ABC transport system permease protein